MSAKSLKKEVLHLYKKLIRIGSSWQAASKDPEATNKEREYIINETKELFRKNSNVSDEAQIREHIKEANARLEIALHYRNPYPRPVNLPPMTVVGMSSSKWKKQKEMRVISKPLYAKSIDIDDVDKNS
ncbi:LYRM1 (predicted) [Pycnogonum litorale]